MTCRNDQVITGLNIIHEVRSSNLIAADVPKKKKKNYDAWILSILRML